MPTTLLAPTYSPTGNASMVGPWSPEVPMLLRFWSEWGPLSGAVVDPMGILENQAMFNVAKVRGERMGAKRRLETGDAVRGKGPWDATQRYQEATLCLYGVDALYGSALKWYARCPTPPRLNDSKVCLRFCLFRVSLSCCAPLPSGTGDGYSGTYCIYMLCDPPRRFRWALWQRQRQRT